MRSRIFGAVSFDSSEQTLITTSVCHLTVLFRLLIKSKRQRKAIMLDTDETSGQVPIEKRSWTKNDNVFAETKC